VLAREVEHGVGVSVHLGTARFEAGAYTGNMHRVSIKAVIAMLWVVAVTIAGIVGNVNSLLLWTVLATVALLPPVLIVRRWSEPRQSMSQSIQEALR
jgi:Flp pilus assembly protein TadB